MFDLKHFGPTPRQRSTYQHILPRAKPQQHSLYDSNQGYGGIRESRGTGGQGVGISESHGGIRGRDTEGPGESSKGVSQGKREQFQ